MSQLKSEVIAFRAPPVGKPLDKSANPAIEADVKQAAKAESTANSGQVQSLIKALKLLQLIAEKPDGLSLKELASLSGYPPSTTHRLLSTMQQENFVRFDNENMRWSIGVTAFVVGNSFIKNRDLVQIARPFMQKLMEETGETVNLAVRDNGKAIYLGQVESREMMRVMSTPGQAIALHCSAVGKAMLAQMSEKERNQVLNRFGMPRVTPKTITSPGIMEQALEHIKNVGYAIDDQEHAMGLRCVASMIYDEVGQPLASVSLSGPLVRISNATLDRLGPAVFETAMAITREYGGVAPAVDRAVDRALDRVNERANLNAC